MLIHLLEFSYNMYVNEGIMSMVNTAIQREEIYLLLKNKFN